MFLGDGADANDADADDDADDADDADDDDDGDDDDYDADEELHCSSIVKQFFHIIYQHLPRGAN